MREKEVYMDDRFVMTLERVCQLFRTCPDPNKREKEHGWSVKEVLGHLLDSLSNNHQRLLRYVPQGNLLLPGYDQELFVRRANYAAFDYSTLLTLWYAYNQLFLHMVANVPAEDLTSTVTVGERPAITLLQLVLGYFAHMEVHEKQVRRIIAA
jgi:hypothetical protein